MIEEEPRCEKKNSANIRYSLILNHLNKFNSKVILSREQITNFIFRYQVNDKREIYVEDAILLVSS